ncbi:ribbon-helix-helix protein, CopG family [Solihabitans fulvus]|uniref:Ribbon-helix-helix protein, CopG family n=1 Tax=Solihabitans fulvus TaxID=1892852 RepID=A0A5B2WCJ2_9PSEU|nr:ribbon-helix-helix protein, CopG family [Solihabitans fulvus]KAA2248874.1 ribbon-helix-helix protein, CopG family [Solihabitans fulvus]
MVTKKVTITLPEEVVEKVSELARSAGLPVSTYLTRLAEHHIRVNDGLAAMREWEAEYGAPSAEAEAWLADHIKRIDMEMQEPHAETS